jgi:hypothetical protein
VNSLQPSRKLNCSFLLLRKRKTYEVRGENPHPSPMESAKPAAKLHSTGPALWNRQSQSSSPQPSSSVDREGAWSYFSNVGTCLYDLWRIIKLSFSGLQETILLGVNRLCRLDIDVVNAFH